MDTDVRGKRRKFIGKFYALRQEFGFASPQVLFKLVNIYGMSFYGSVLWDLGGSASDTLYASWNTLVRTIWKLLYDSFRCPPEIREQVVAMKTSCRCLCARC